MNIETKYSIGQEVFILTKGIGKVYSGKVRSIYVEVHKNRETGDNVQHAKYVSDDGVGPWPEEEWFPSKEELLKSL